MVSIFRRFSLSVWKQSKHIDFYISSLFSLLGWTVSLRKLVDFKTLCKVLGVRLDFKQSGDGLCFVANTAERVVTEIDEGFKQTCSEGQDEVERALAIFQLTSLCETFQATVESPVQPRHCRKADSVT